MSIDSSCLALHFIFSNYNHQTKHIGRKFAKTVYSSARHLLHFCIFRQFPIKRLLGSSWAQKTFDREVKKQLIGINFINLVTETSKLLLSKLLFIMNELN